MKKFNITETLKNQTLAILAELPAKSVLGIIDLWRNEAHCKECEEKKKEGAE